MLGLGTDVIKAVIISKDIKIAININRLTTINIVTTRLAIQISVKISIKIAHDIIIT